MMMKRYGMVALVLLAGCKSDPRNELELDTVVACETAMKRNMVSSGSYQSEPDWIFTMQGTDGMVGRIYSATNGFGARIDAKYFCQYDPVTRSIAYLMVEEPTGTRLLVAR